MAMAFFSACSDIRTDKIPNEGICLFWGTGFFYQILTKGEKGLILFLTGALLPLFLLSILFLFRMVGAGDLKLLSALGGMMGPGAIVTCMVCSFLIGGVLSLAVVWTAGNLKERLRYFANYIRRYRNSKVIVPYFRRGKQLENIHFSVPVFMAVMLYTGGFY